MKTLLLIGRTGSGKTTFCQAMAGEKINYKKTQAPEFLKDAFLDTPGEYIENRLYSAISVLSADCDVIAIFQECTNLDIIFPPSFAGMFAKPLIGIITKMDLCEKNSDIERVEEILRMAGAERIFRISSLNRTGFKEIKEYIEN
ncbi:MAG TPA: ethanolamine utilization protein EutP [Clostridium sp.]|jgi:ethanolamine utilization protein EutP|uniref:EutP/PduV family microcompartment system protein n=1 Tax=Clostridium lapidicellarium TaxID=3240931 RepID=A0ABV4E023_9CLOT|nr:EutP/PduV family microcompartment system protein [uncultured Clostridium sp.]NLU06695.1 EutP/PduV family microcompartment system protein [Clostridiales bacterium]HBC97649.1 ethanolamine utilization protein EutP [Clostridium sp.]